MQPAHRPGPGPGQIGPLDPLRAFPRAERAENPGDGDSGRSRPLRDCRGSPIRITEKNPQQKGSEDRWQGMGPYRSIVNRAAGTALSGTLR